MKHCVLIVAPISLGKTIENTTKRIPIEESHCSEYESCEPCIFGDAAATFIDWSSCA